MSRISNRTMAGLLLAILIFTSAQCANLQIYEAYTLLRVRQQPEVIYDLNSGIMSMPPARHPIRSPLVINAALAQPGIKNLPWIASRASSGTEENWLELQIELRSMGGEKKGAGEILRISIKGDDPAQLQKLVGAITEAYLEKIAREERRNLVARWNLLEATCATKRQEVNRRRELVRTLAERLGTADSKLAQAKQELLLDYVLKLRKQITENRSVMFQKELALHRGIGFHRLKEGEKDEVKERDLVELAALVQELDGLKAKDAAMGQEFEDLKQMIEELGTTCEELERRKEDLASVQMTLNKLLRIMEQYDLELRSPERITLLQKATAVRFPAEDQ